MPPKQSHIPKAFLLVGFLLREVVLMYQSFFAKSWRTPQPITSNYRSKLRQEYTSDLELLLRAFPSRFHRVIQECLDSIDAILNLPAVLLHRDFSTANLVVDRKTCNLKGVLDWGEAGLGTFGQNLHFIQNLMCVLDLERGWRPYNDYNMLQETFWSTFQRETGNVSEETIRTIKLASAMGLLLYRGFTRRLAGMPCAQPICEDQEGSYSFLYLDAFLLNPASNIIDFY